MFLAESTIQLVPDGTLLLHMLIIGIMVVVLNRTLLKPINQILERRDALLSGRVTEAEVLEAARQEKVQSYEAALRDARSQGYHLLEAEKAKALREKEQRIGVAKDEASKRVTEAIEQTRRQEEQAKNDLETQASELSNLIGSRVLRRPIR